MMRSCGNLLPTRALNSPWPDPPLTSDKWVVNISSTDFWHFTKLGKNEVVDGATLEEALEKARRLVDDL
jgi:hypothetical protein